MGNLYLLEEASRFSTLTCDDKYEIVLPSYLKLKNNIKASQ